MESSIRIQNERKEIIAVTLFAIMAIYFFAQLIQRELKPGNLGGSQRTVVARLQLATQNVQRKFDKEVLWESVASSVPLYTRDSVRTAEKSAARILFEDGSLIEMAENSLIVLDRTDEKIQVDFMKGSVFAKAKGIEINTGRGKIELGKDKKGELSLVAGQSGLEVTVAEGSAKIKTDKGEAVLGVNEKGSLSDGGISQQKLKLRGTLPEQNAKFVVAQGAAPIQFAWEGDKEFVPISRLQIARDSSFRSPVKFSASELADGKASVALAEGTYYWRVIAKGTQAGPDGKTKNEVSDQRLLQVIRHWPVQLDQPMAGSKISFFKQAPSVALSWRSQVREGEQEVQISKDAKFSQLLPKISSVSEGNSFRAGVNGIEPGKYFWRVVTRYDGMGAKRDEKLALNSDVRGFEIQKLDQLPSPVLVQPAENASLALGKDKSKIFFSWQPVSEANGYKIVVARDAKLKSVVLEQKLGPMSSFEMPFQETGTFHWSVEAISAEETSDPAQSRSFVSNRVGGFNLIAPKAAQAFSYLKRKPVVKFQWEKISGTKTYILQVSGDPDFKSVSWSQESDEPQIESDELPSGVKYWRVVARGDRAQSIGISETRQYRLEMDPLMAAPVKMEPQSGFKVQLGAEESARKVKLEWKAVEKTRGYRLYLYKQPAGGKQETILDGEEVDELFFEKKLQAGAYQWDVRAVDEVKRTGQAGSMRSFEVVNAFRLAPPIAKAPLNRAMIQEPKPVPVKFKWESVEGADGYLISIYQVGEGGKLKLVQKKDTSDTEYKTEKMLKAGTYKWQVVAHGKLKGEPAVFDLNVKWTDFLRAPMKVRMQVEGDRIPASRR
ncbi:FecR family protein [bacterium]|nr:FecR family protein [bacterium]